MWKGGHKTHFAQNLGVVAILLLCVGGGVRGIVQVISTEAPDAVVAQGFLLSTGPLHWYGTATGPAAFSPIPGSFFAFPDT